MYCPQLLQTGHNDPQIEIEHAYMYEDIGCEMHESKMKWQKFVNLSFRGGHSELL